MFYDFINKYTDIFVEKMREAFALQKILTFFNKNIAVFEIFKFEILTKRLLRMSLVLNNRSQLF